MGERERLRKAEDKALERLDYILERYVAPDFMEIVGRIGGDIVTYRIYDDGSMYEDNFRKSAVRRGYLVGYCFLLDCIFHYFG